MHAQNGRGNSIDLTALAVQFLQCDMTHYV